MSETTLHDTISALMDKSEAGEPLAMDEPVEVVEPVEPVEGVKADAPPIGEVLETPEQKAGRTAGRARDEQGRLLPGAAVKPVEVAPVEPPKPPLARPSSWKKDYEPHWNKLVNGEPLTPVEARALAEYNLQRESEAAKGVSTYKSEWDNAKPLMDAIAPFLPELQQHNIPPAQWISNLGNAHRQLSLGDAQTKLQMFSKLAQDYGVPLQALYDPQFAQQFVQQNLHAQPVQPQVDPRQAVREEMEAYFTKQKVTEFAQSKDTSGNPLYPHYEAVRNDMALLLEAGKAQDLSSAYKMALRLSDDLWQSDQDAKAKSDESARLEAQRKAVQTARSNAVSPRSATPAGTGATSKKGLRGTLEDAFDEVVQGRV